MAEDEDQSRRRPDRGQRKRRRLEDGPGARPRVAVDETILSAPPPLSTLTAGPVSSQPRSPPVVDLTNSDEEEGNNQEDDEVQVVGTIPAPRPLPLRFALSSLGRASLGLQQRGSIATSLEQRLRRMQETHEEIRRQSAMMPGTGSSSSSMGASRGGAGPSPSSLELLRTLSIARLRGPSSGGVGNGSNTTSFPAAGSPVVVVLSMGGRDGPRSIVLLRGLEELHPMPRGATEEAISQIPTRVVPDSKQPSKSADDEEKEHKEEQAKCSICLDEYEPGQRVATLPCHHEYHSDCISKWLREDKHCCLCKQPIG